MERQLENIGAQYEISEAAEAEELNRSDERLFDPVLVRNSWYRPAMAASMLSHLRVYRQVLENGHEVALVLEDDTLLPADLSALTPLNPTSPYLPPNPSLSLFLIIPSPTSTHSPLHPHP